MLNVDPSNIVGHMIKHGGLLVSPAMDRDLKLMGEFCHADSCQLNVVERRLLIHNFTIRLPDDDSAQEDSLRIQRIAVQWDSYLKPCVEIEVDDVFILVDFFNVFLTQNNWYVCRFTVQPTLVQQEAARVISCSMALMFLCI